MKYAHWYALALGIWWAGCGGVTRIGVTRDNGGSSGNTMDGGDVSGSGGAGTGGKLGTGGRASGGRFGSGGRFSAGGFSFGGRAGHVSFGGRGDGGVSSGGRRDGGVALGGRFDGGFGTGGREFDGGTDPDRNRVPAGHVCDRLTTLQCAGEQHCCPTNRSYDTCKN